MMIPPFTLKPLPKIEFGRESLNTLPSHVKSFGSRVLLLTGGKSLQQSGYKDKILSLLEKSHTRIFFAEINHEPSPRLIDHITRQYQNHELDVVIGIGGGSVLDSGKAISAMLPVATPVQEYLEGVGTRQPTGLKIPFIAIPTTSGTGSEVTNNAVLSQNGPDGFKKSLRHDCYIPDIAIIDPLLTCSCIPAVTAHCGMDTFSQLVEAYLSTNSSIITDGIAIQGIKAISRSLAVVYNNGQDINGRTDLAFASLCSGIVLMNAGLGVVHGLAPVLGCYYPIPHGVACGTLMAAANDITLRKLESERANDDALRKYSQLGRIFCPETNKSDLFYRNYFIDFLYKKTELFNIPRLSFFGVSEDSLAPISTVSSNKYNPTTLVDKDIVRILQMRL